MPSDKKLHFVVLLFLFLLHISCGNSISENELSELKYFKNLNATMLTPAGYNHIEGPAAYTFSNDAQDKIYIISVYNQQTPEQVKQIMINGVNSGPISITKKGDFTTTENGLSSVDVIVTTPQAKVDGYILLKEIPNMGTYSYFTFAMNSQSLEALKENLKKIAASTVVGQKSGAETIKDVDKMSYGNMSPKAYQDLLDDKVLVWSDRDKSTVSVDDNTQSHSKSTYYQNVEKIRRFVFCANGWAYFRYISIGDQMTGDTGMAEYEKFSGHWKISYENGQCYIFMQDERDNRTRSWLINRVEGDMITIDNVTYRMSLDIKSKGECQGDFKVPGE